MGARVLVGGLATLDVVQTVERVPGPDEKVVAHGLSVAAGGPAANAAVTCAALGVDARLVTRVGGGALASAVLEDLRARGVEVVDLAAPGATPPVSTVLVTRATGERAVVSVNATAAGSAAGGGDGEVPAAVWDDVGLVLVDGHHLDVGLALAGAARGRGVPVLLDGGSWKPGLADLLRLVDVAVVSADFAVPGESAGRGDVLDAVCALGPRVAARSAGAGPIEVRLADGRRGQVRVPAVDVVDTLGAGDVLHGALAAWLASRLAGGDDPRDAVLAGLTWAAAVASASCAAAGARGWTADAALVARLRADLAA